MYHFVSALTSHEIEIYPKYINIIYFLASLCFLEKKKMMDIVEYVLQLPIHETILQIHLALENQS